jgi:hypothetical protein
LIWPPIILSISRGYNNNANLIFAFYIVALKKATKKASQRLALPVAK